MLYFILVLLETKVVEYDKICLISVRFLVASYAIVIRSVEASYLVVVQLKTEFDIIWFQGKIKT